MNYVSFYHCGKFRKGLFLGLEYSALWESCYKLKPVDAALTGKEVDNSSLKPDHY